MSKNQLKPPLTPLVRMLVTILVPVCVVVALFCAVWVALYSPGDLGGRYSLFLPPVLVKSENRALNLTLMSGNSERQVYQIKLASARADELAKTKKIALMFATNRATPRLISAQLELGGADCTFRSQTSAQLEDNKLLAMEAYGICPKRTFSHEVPVTITVVTEGAKGVAIWTAKVSVDEKYQVDEILLPYMHFVDDQGRFFPYGVVHFPVAGLPTLRKIDLLAKMWDLPSADLLTKLLLFSAFLAFVGTVLLTWSFLCGPSGRRKVFLSLGFAFWFFGLGVSYCFLIPPFHAADEPDHFLSFIQGTYLQPQARHARVLANKGHFERIKFRAGERFTVHSAASPLLSQWSSHIGPSSISTRAPVLEKLIKVYLFAGGKRSVQYELLAFRLTNALIFSLGIGLFCLLFSLSGLSGFLILLGLGTLFPLPYFAAMVSNYAILATLFGLHGILFCYFLLRREAPLMTYLVLGILIGLTFFTSQSGILIVAFWAAFLPLQNLIRLICADEDWWLAGKSIVHQFLMLSIGCALTILFSTGAYLDTVGSRYAHIFNSSVLPNKVLALLPLVLFLFSTLLGNFGLKLGQKMLRRLSSRREILTKVGGVAMLVVIGILLISPLFYPFNPLPNIEGAKTFSAANYVVKVLKTFAVNLNVFMDDHFLVRTLWSGFGWLEFHYPTWVLGLMRLPILLALCLIAVRAIFGDAQTFFSTAGGAIALVGYLVALALGTYFSGANLHGRYLLGFYCLFLPLIFSSLNLDDPKFHKAKILVLVLTIATMIFAHGFNFDFIVSRYL